jgi:2-keto-4-pentenoate hydratase/2-oxohepta-3-ene-1,7-dioic acid hydratase in catechol pathway
VKLLHPSEPKVIIGLGGSYSDSWKDKKPYNSVRWFLKPPSAAASPNDTVNIPVAVDAIKVEVELTIVIGKTVKNATEQEAEKAIFGYTIGNDIVGWTDSYHEKEGEPKDQKEPLLGPGLKIGDRFAPFGPFIYTNFNWKNRERKMLVTDISGNEKINTSHNTSKLVYSPAKIISDLSKVLTLSPGDIVMTGTNKSYVVVDGDIVSVSVEGLGTLTNTIKR